MKLSYKFFNLNNIFLSKQRSFPNVGRIFRTGLSKSYVLFVRFVMLVISEVNNVSHSWRILFIISPIFQLVSERVSAGSLSFQWHLLEGGSTTRPPVIDGSNFAYWKARMKSFLISIDSGCSSYMTGNRFFFSKFKRCYSKDTIVANKLWFSRWKCQIGGEIDSVCWLMKFWTKLGLLFFMNS